MGSIIECIKRTYSIQTSDGIKLEVENEKPLSGAITARLLKEDSEIGFFFEKCKILDIDISRKKRTKEVKQFHKRSAKKSKTRKKKRLREELEEETKPILEEPLEQQVQEKLSPLDRLNILLNMEGEFTRHDYQKFMKDLGYDMSNFMGHEDIESAVLLNKVEPTGEKIGKNLKIYRIIDTNIVGRDVYNGLKEHRMKMKYKY